MYEKNEIKKLKGKKKAIESEKERTTNEK